MAIPSGVNNVIHFTTADRAIADTRIVTGFLVNVTTTNWRAEIQDSDNQIVFKASGSAAESFYSKLGKPIQFKNMSATTFTGVSDLLAYIE